MAPILWIGLAFGPAEPAPEPAPEPADGAVVELSGADEPSPVPEGPAAPPPAPAPQATDPETTRRSAAAPTPTVTRERVKKVYPSIPIAWRIEAAIGGGTNTLFHRSYLAFDDNRQLPGMDVAVRADYRVAEGPVFLGATAFYRRFGSSGTLFETAASDDMTLHEPGLGLRLAIETVEGVDVYAELAGGPTIADVTLDDGEGNVADQRKVTGMGSGLAGVLLYLPKRWLPRRGSSRVTVGLDGGFGYVFRGGIGVQPDPEVADDAIGTSTAPLGDLVTRGLTWRLGLFVRVM